jgi:hypothetical protein
MRRGAAAEPVTAHAQRRAVAAAFAELRHAASVVRSAQAATTLHEFEPAFNAAYAAWTETRTRIDASLQEHHAAQRERLHVRHRSRACAWARSQADGCALCPAAASASGALRRGRGGGDARVPDHFSAAARAAGAAEHPPVHASVRAPEVRQGGRVQGACEERAEHARAPPSGCVYENARLCRLSRSTASAWRRPTSRRCARCKRSKHATARLWRLVHASVTPGRGNAHADAMYTRATTHLNSCLYLTLRTSCGTRTRGACLSWARQLHEYGPASWWCRVTTQQWRTAGRRRQNGQWGAHTARRRPCIMQPGRQRSTRSMHGQLAALVTTTTISGTLALRPHPTGVLQRLRRPAGRRSKLMGNLVLHTRDTGSRAGPRRRTLRWLPFRRAGAAARERHLVLQRRALLPRARLTLTRSPSFFRLQPRCLTAANTHKRPPAGKRRRRRCTSRLLRSWRRVRLLAVIQLTCDMRPMMMSAVRTSFLLAWMTEWRLRLPLLETFLTTGGRRSHLRAMSSVTTARTRAPPRTWVPWTRCGMRQQATTAGSAAARLTTKQPLPRVVRHCCIRTDPRVC